MPSPLPLTATARQMAQWIVNAEARRDKQGRLTVYTLPKGDGGGFYEIAGINDGYHPNMAARLRDLISNGLHGQAEREAVDYIARCTAKVGTWVSDPGLEFFLRDTAWNRGLGGAAQVLQMACGVAHDGDVGPITREALKRRLLYAGADLFLHCLREQREAYERRIAPPVGNRAKFWPGLVNRWNAAMKEAQRWNDQAVPASPVQCSNEATDTQDEN